MPYTRGPVEGATPLRYQGRDGWDAAAKGQVSGAEQSTPEHVYDATQGSGWTWDRWRKTPDSGEADMNTGEPTGTWMPDGTSDASRWKEV